jgi:hypothetical protein
MNIRKLWVEYLKTANKLYGSWHLALYNLTLLAIMVFLSTTVIAMGAVIFYVYHIAPAGSGFIINSILQPIFYMVIVFQALTILIGFLVSHLDCVVKAE